LKNTGLMQVCSCRSFCLFARSAPGKCFLLRYVGGSFFLL